MSCVCRGVFVTLQPLKEMSSFMVSLGQNHYKTTFKLFLLKNGNKNQIIKDEHSKRIVPSDSILRNTSMRVAPFTFLIAISLTRC